VRFREDSTKVRFQTRRPPCLSEAWPDLAPQPSAWPGPDRAQAGVILRAEYVPCRARHRWTGTRADLRPLVGLPVFDERSSARSSITSSSEVATMALSCQRASRFRSF